MPSPRWRSSRARSTPGSRGIAWPARRCRNPRIPTPGGKSFATGAARPGRTAARCPAARRWAGWWFIAGSFTPRRFIRRRGFSVSRAGGVGPRCPRPAGACSPCACMTASFSRRATMRRMYSVSTEPAGRIAARWGRWKTRKLTLSPFTKAASVWGRGRRGGCTGIAATITGRTWVGWAANSKSWGCWCITGCSTPAACRWPRFIGSTARETGARLAGSIKRRRSPTAARGR